MRQKNTIISSCIHSLSSLLFSIHIFNVKNKSMLSGLKTGDSVKFVAASEGGKLYVTEIKKGNENESN